MTGISAWLVEPIRNKNGTGSLIFLLHSLTPHDNTLKPEFLVDLITSLASLEFKILRGPLFYIG
jgi:hypothetical protein